MPGDDLQVREGFVIRDSDLDESFVRSSGPGGQNVNKVATAVQLRFDVWGSDLPQAVKERLIALAGSRADNRGVVMIEARRFRTQERNRQDARDRLVELVRRAFEKPKPRKKTKPSKRAKRRRVEAKRQRGELKRLRKTPRRDT